MKHYFKTLSALLILYSVLILFAGVKGKAAVPNSDVLIENTPTEYGLKLDVYYVNKENLLVAEYVEAKIKANAFFESVLDIIKVPPWDVKYDSLVDETVLLRSANIDGRSLTLDFGSEFLKSKGEDAAYLDALVYSIVNTYTSLELVDKVRILVDGVGIEKYLSNYGPEFLTFNDVMLYKKPSTPQAVMRAFFDYLNAKRYDLAYNLTTSSYEYNMEDVAFDQDARRFLNQNKSVIRRVDTVSGKDGIYFVRVKLYTWDSEELVLKKYGLEQWKVVTMADSSLKLIWRWHSSK